MTLPLDLLLERLDGVRGPSTGPWTANCPGHDDRHASLSVNVGADDLPLLYCHAGCTLREVLLPLGMLPGDLFPKEIDRIPRPGRMWMPTRPIRPMPSGPVRIVPEVEVTNAAERLYASPWASAWLDAQKGWTRRAIRALGIGFDGQRFTFPVRRADGACVGVLRYLPGGAPKMLAQAGTPRDLFPRPESFAWARTVWLVEGEPDAVTGAVLGLPAVAVPGVAKWDDAWAARFRDQHVIVCMDSDAPGRAAAERIASVLPHAHVVDLAPYREDGFDLGDAHRAAVRNGGVGRLRALLDNLAHGGHPT